MDLVRIRENTKNDFLHRIGILLELGDAVFSDPVWVELAETVAANSMFRFGEWLQEQTELFVAGGLPVGATVTETVCALLGEATQDLSRQITDEGLVWSSLEDYGAAVEAAREEATVVEEHLLDEG